MTSTINASTSSGIVQTADTSGVLAIQANGTTGMTFGPGAAVSTTNTINTPGVSLGFKNRIINGAMMIDQRNAGAAVSLTNANVAYPVDRTFVENNSGTGVLSVQQVSDAPTGFTKSLKVTVTTNDTSLGSTDRTYVNQRIEGYNVADLDFGLVTAKTITISFWVKSSLTGTFGGVLLNGAGNRSYPYTYAISSANTWEYKTITISGDNTGTWTTNNTTGIQLLWGLGVGSTFSGTPNVWSSTTYLSATGAVNLTATLNATWQITGVQLEVGTAATSFEFRDYGRELIMCQRYFVKYTYANGNPVTTFANWDSVNLFGEVYLPVIPRATPTFSYGSAAGDFLAFQASVVKTVTSIGSNLSATQTQELSFSVASGYSTGLAGFVRTQTANGWLSFSAEL